MPKLTKRFVDSVKPEGEREIVYWDETLPGFGLRVRSSGSKTFVCQYRNTQGRTRKLTLGPFGRLTVEEARRLAKERLGEVAQGLDPAEVKSTAKGIPTVSELASRYLIEHSEVKKKPESIRKDRFIVDRYILPVLGRYSIDEVGREQISIIHHELRDKPYQANRVLEIIRKIFNLAEAWGLRPDNTNPCRHIQKYREHKRQRYLSEEEWGRLGKVLATIENDGSETPSSITAIRLLIFTGCRLSEVLNLKWDKIDWERGCIFLADSKTGSRYVPLGRIAVELLEKTPRQVGNPFVCPGAKPMRPLVNLERPWRRVRKLAGLDDVRLHDLRHSYASVGAGAGMGLPIIGALLGHTQAQTTARYSHLAMDPLRAATEEVGKRIAEAMSKQPAQKVVQLPLKK